MKQDGMSKMGMGKIVSQTEAGKTGGADGERALSLSQRSKGTMEEWKKETVDARRIIRDAVLRQRGDENKACPRQRGDGSGSAALGFLLHRSSLSGSLLFSVLLPIAIEIKPC